MGEMQVFNHKQFGNVRSIEIDGVPWFVAADVCKALDHSNPTVAMSRLDDDEKAKLCLGLPGGDTNCVNEYGIYDLVLTSRKKEAKEFKRWVKHEVLPSIRKTGGYIMGEEKMTDDEIMASALLVANRKLEERAARIKSLENKIAIDVPKVDFADALLVCDNCSYIEELAKQLCQIGMKTGRNRLIAEMADDGFLCVRNGVKNMPTQKCVEAGWLVIERKPHIEGERSVMGFTTKVTPSGMQHFMAFYMRKHGLMPLLTTSRTRQSRYNNIATTNVCGHENKKKYNLR